MPSASPSSASLQPGGPASSSVRWYETVSPETLDALQTLWDPEEGRVDLRRFSIDALKALHLYGLRDCEEARYVALPAHCPAQVLHSLLFGLPRLEGLMAWSPSNPGAVRLAMGRHLKVFVTDENSAHQVSPVDGIKAMVGSGSDLSVDAIAGACDFATLPRPDRGRAVAPSVSRMPAERPLSLFLGERPTATASAAIGQRLANWRAPETAVSRPPLSLPITPDAMPDTATGIVAKAGPSAKRRLAKSVSCLLRDCETALRRVSRLPLRRSKSV